MRLIKYNTELSEDNNPILVKEKSFNYGTQTLDTPELIGEMFNNVFRLNKQTEEYIYLLCLNTKCRPIGIFEISHGTINYSISSPREIFSKALLCGAAHIILCHNHPSGDTSPSKGDIEVYNKVKQAGEILNVKLSDFLIIGEDTLSFVRNGY